MRSSAASPKGWDIQSFNLELTHRFDLRGHAREMTCVDLGGSALKPFVSCPSLASSAFSSLQGGMTPRLAIAQPCSVGIIRKYAHTGPGLTLPGQLTGRDRPLYDVDFPFNRPL
jgi:hypothetical protein